MKCGRAGGTPPSSPGMPPPRRDPLSMAPWIRGRLLRPPSLPPRPPVRERRSRRRFPEVPLPPGRGLLRLWRHLRRQHRLRYLHRRRRYPRQAQPLEFPRLRPPAPRVPVRGASPAAAVSGSVLPAVRRVPAPGAAVPPAEPISAMRSRCIWTVRLRQLLRLLLLEASVPRLLLPLGLLPAE